MFNELDQFGWRAGLLPVTIAKIDEAIDALHANHAYEQTSATARETLASLEEIADHAGQLVAAINALSRVGCAAMFEAGMRRRADTGRHELRPLARRLVHVELSAREGAARLLREHEPFSDGGQGSGSALGRDSDLRAVRAAHDRKSSLPPLRSPKDKFAFAVVKALMRHEPDLNFMARGAAKSLREFLSDVWIDVRHDVRKAYPPNWDTVIRARTSIAELVENDRKYEKIWRTVQARRNASSSNSRRSPPKE